MSQALANAVVAGARRAVGHSRGLLSGRGWPAWSSALLFSAKTTVAALAALGVSLMVGLPMPFWAMTTVYITSNPVSAATRSKAIYRVMGTAIGAAVTIVLVPALVDWPALLSLALALWVGGCLAVSLLDRSPRAYVLMLAGYTAAIVGFPSVSAPEAVFDVASARVTEIILGITMVTLTQSLIFPLSLGERLGPRLNAWLGDAETWLADVLADLPDADARGGRDRQRMAVDALDCVVLASHVPYDTSHWREAHGTVQALLYRMLLLLPLLSGMADRRGVLGSDHGIDPAVDAARAWIDAGTPVDAVPDYLSDEAAGTEGPRDWPGLLRESFVVRLAQTSTVLAEARQLLARLDDPVARLPDALDRERVQLRLTSDPGLAVLSGASAALGILVVCAFWIMTGWPDGGGAAAMAAVFCCLFAAMDNPTPMILAFGGAIVASLPVAGVYLFGILPWVDGFPALCVALLPPCLIVGMVMVNPRHGVLGTAWFMGFCSALAFQEQYTADLAKFINNGLAQVVAVVVAAGVTAACRTTAASAAINRLARRQRDELARLARASQSPDPAQVLTRASDQLALITQRLGSDDTQAVASLRDVRLAVNIATIQQLRVGAARPLRAACARLLRTTGDHFAARRPGLPSPELLRQLDKALRLTLDAPPPQAGHAGELIGSDPATGRAALVAMRRNLFPDAAAFVAVPAATPISAEAGQ